MDRPVDHEQAGSLSAAIILERGNFRNYTWLYALHIAVFAVDVAGTEACQFETVVP